MNEQMKPIHPASAALLMGKCPEPSEPFVEVSSKVLARLLDVVEFGDQLERVEKDRLLSSMKELLALEKPALWATFSPGPGEVHPCISKEHAEQEAKATLEVCEKMKADKIARGQSVEFWPKIVVDVIPSPFTPLEHFELLAEETIQHRDELVEYVNELEQKTAPATAVVNQQLTTAGLTSVRCQCCQAEHATASYDAGFIAGSGMCKVCDAAIPAKDIHTPAASDVLAERQRQITAKGWTPAHDDLYCAAELPRAAASYILNGANDKAPAIWPFASKWWKPKDARANYVRASALILAEIERLDRAEQAKQQEQQP